MNQQSSQVNQFLKLNNMANGSFRKEQAQNITPRKNFLTFIEQRPNETTQKLNQRQSVFTKRKISQYEVQQKSGSLINRDSEKSNIDKIQESNSQSVNNTKSLQKKVFELVIDQKKKFESRKKLSINFPYLKRRAVSLTRKNEQIEINKALYELSIKDSLQNQIKIKNNSTIEFQNLQIQNVSFQTKITDQKFVKIYKGEYEKDRTGKITSVQGKNISLSLQIDSDTIDDQKPMTPPQKKNKENQQTYRPKVNNKKPLIKISPINFPQYEDNYLQKKQETLNNETLATLNDSQQLDKTQSINSGKLPLQEPFLPPINANYNYTLVLDLDETLVHFQEIGFMRQILVRPYVDQFLKEMNKYFEIVIFTAGTEDYASWIIDQIDPNKYIKYRLFRQHTSPTKQNLFIKDLEKLGRVMSKIIIIDNIPQNYSMQPHNGIQIQSWFDDPRDKALLELIPILKQIVQQNDDVREILRRFQMQQF